MLYKTNLYFHEYVELEVIWYDEDTTFVNDFSLKTYGNVIIFADNKGNKNPYIKFCQAWIHVLLRFMQIIKKSFSL